jgi:hypothetical protein
MSMANKRRDGRAERYHLNCYLSGAEGAFLIRRAKELDVSITSYLRFMVRDEESRVEFRELASKQEEKEDS